MANMLWWVTRPTRDLHDLEESLKCFARLAEGRKWSGDREMHQRFEVENPAKTSHSGIHGSMGSGGRTWAAWLRSWGMWYDEENVTLTDAAKMIIGARDKADVHKQIVHMIMTFQITSAYHESLRAGHYSEFRVFPFRLILKLLLDKDVSHLSLDEIGLFLLPVKNHSEYASIVSKIRDWRSKCTDAQARKNLMNRLIASHMRKYHIGRTDSPDTPDGYWRSVRDVASTFAVNIRYVTEITYDSRRRVLRVPDEDADSALTLLRKYEDGRFSTLYEFSEATFARRFGIRYDRRKASAKETRPRTPATKQRGHILRAVEDIRREGGVPPDQMLGELKRRISYRTEVIERVLTANPDLVYGSAMDEMDHLEAHYLNCAGDGAMHTEFEKLTRKIFTLMGFKTEKMRTARNGGSSAEIDGLILNDETKMAGLLECKAGKKYAFSIGDTEKMKHTYIRNFRTRRVDHHVYTLDLFVYVVGIEAGGLENFRGIAKETGVRGSVIYARDMIRMYRMFKEGRISGVKVWRILKSNQLITWADIERESS